MKIGRVQQRWFATVAIFVGAIVLGFDPNRWEYVLVDLPVHDLVGIALVSVGTFVLWRARALDPKAVE